MRAARSIHLLIVAAILFSQIVSGVHMAGHVHVPIAGLLSASAEGASPASLHATHSATLTAVEHQALHQQKSRQAAAAPTAAVPDHGDNHLDPSCVIYHVYAGSHGVAVGAAMVVSPRPLASAQAALESAVLPARRVEHHSIRGPPAVS